ncbi:LysM peptidoglycan-binding domain-containing protein, partial [Microvirga sp. 3-52]|nr:LysM peptidoglycan-binding domain-containing protein [Microvirga sp. 3-52]
KEYTVEKGDTLYRIGNMHNVSVADIMAKNNLKSTVIYPKQKLQVGSIANVSITSAAKAKTTAPTKSTKAKASKKVETPSRSTSQKAVKEFTVTATAYTAYCNGCSGIT